MPVISPRADWFPPDLPTTATTTTPSADYGVFFLRHTWNGLALFAVFVIARRAVRRVSARWRRNNAATNTDTPSDIATDDNGQHAPFRDNITYPRGKQSGSPRRSSAPYRPRHYHFPSAALPPWTMAGHSGAADSGLPQQGHQAPATAGEQARSAPGQSGTGRGDAPLPRYIMARPPPAAPLTPPPPSHVFTPEHGALGASLIHQPNPDYLTPTSPPPTTSSDPTLPQAQSSPLSIPAPHSRSSSSDANPSPRSLPSPTPFLPPAFDGSGKSVDVQGEVVSVTDGFGTGWTRHTRVYGGGVCLACAASGEGFYGATALRPEGS